MPQLQFVQGFMRFEIAAEKRRKIENGITKLLLVQQVGILCYFLSTYFYTATGTVAFVYIDNSKQTLSNQSDFLQKRKS